MTTGANARQVSGDHYKGAKIEVWDFITANDIGYLEGNAIKYLARWKKKGGVNDIRKALHYVEKLLEVADAEAAVAAGKTLEAKCRATEAALINATTGAGRGRGRLFTTLFMAAALFTAAPAQAKECYTAEERGALRAFHAAAALELRNMVRLYPRDTLPALQSQTLTVAEASEELEWAELLPCKEASEKPAAAP